MNHADVVSWIARYEEAWRSPGSDLLAELFAPDVAYLPSPWAEEIHGLAALATFWEEERDGPDEHFAMTSELVALEERTAVARIAVEYENDGSWRDLWVLTFSGRRCSRFEEWPFAPGQDDGH